MKKLFMLSMLAILTLTLVGCGKSGSGASGITDSSQALKEITLKEALTKKGTHIWYELYVDEDKGYRLDKEERIDNAYIFKDGEVLVTELRKFDETETSFESKYKRISLGEVSKMSDSEIIEASNVYKKYLEGKVAENSEESELYKKTLDKLKYESFTFGIETDSTGNNTQTEYFSTKTYKKLWEDIMGNYGPYQIYDTYFCGYQEYDFTYREYEENVFITKCKSNSVYTLDKVGTKGISIDED